MGKQITIYSGGLVAIDDSKEEYDCIGFVGYVDDDAIQFVIDTVRNYIRPDPSIIVIVPNQRILDRVIKQIPVNGYTLNFFDSNIIDDNVDFLENYQIHYATCLNYLNVDTVQRLGFRFVDVIVKYDIQILELVDHKNISEIDIIGDGRERYKFSCELKLKRLDICGAFEQDNMLDHFLDQCQEIKKIVIQLSSLSYLPTDRYYEYLVIQLGFRGGDLISLINLNIGRLVIEFGDRAARHLDRLDEIISQCSIISLELNVHNYSQRTRDQCDRLIQQVDRTRFTRVKSAAHTAEIV